MASGVKQKKSLFTTPPLPGRDEREKARAVVEKGAEVYVKT
jgi:hypothetical protein